MSKVFGTIAAVILAAAAFVAWKNNKAYEQEKGFMQTEQKEEKGTAKELVAQQKRLVDAEEAQKDNLARTEEAQKKLEEANEERVRLKRSIIDLKKDHKSKKREVADTKEALKELPDPDILIPKIRVMKDELVRRVTATRQVIEGFKTGKSLPNLKTRISSIYRNWGFVILAAGDRQGVIAGSTLDVVRGGEVVGKLKVSAVEAGRSSADIIPGSVAEGTTLRTGDTVVPEKEDAKPEAAGATAAAK